MKIKDCVEKRKTIKADLHYSPYIEIGDIDTFTKEYSIKDKSSVAGSVIAYCGDILVSTVRPTRGAVTIVKENSVAVSAAFAVVHPDASKSDPKYLFYCLNSKPFLEYLGSVSKGATYPTCSKDDVFNYPLQDYNKLEQTQIANLLDRLSLIIQNRKKELQLLDNLVKARFVEMFKGGQYPVVRAADVCEYITKGTTPSSNEIFSEPKIDSIPYLKVYNLSFDGSLRFFEEPQYISRKIHEGKLARSKVLPNDVLMNIVGPPLGKLSLVTNDFPEWNINQAIAVFRAKERVLPTFLLYSLMHPNVLMPFLNNAQGVRQLNISLEQCRNITFSLPTVKEQEAFCRFVEQINQSKLVVQRALDKAQLLFDSLMQKYFG